MTKVNIFTYYTKANSTNRKLIGMNFEVDEDTQISDNYNFSRVEFQFAD